MKDMDLERVYNKLEDLRKEVKENEKALEYYAYLKELNRQDQMYGWIFNDDSILEDTLEDLDIYQKPYVLSVLNVYVNELDSILNKVNNL